MRGCTMGDSGPVRSKKRKTLGDSSGTSVRDAVTNGRRACAPRYARYYGRVHKSVKEFWRDPHMPTWILVPSTDPFSCL